MKESYTRYPRLTLWLVPDDEVRIGGPQPDSQPSFLVDVAPFYISRCPITNEHFEAFAPDHARAGSFRTPAAELSVSRRRALDPNARLDDVGFRIVRNLR